MAKLAMASTSTVGNLTFSPDKCPAHKQPATLFLGDTGKCHRRLPNFTIQSHHTRSALTGEQSLLLGSNHWWVQKHACTPRGRKSA